MKSPRTGARELALHLLYQMDLRNEELTVVLPELLEFLRPTEEDRAFALQLAEGTIEHGEAIDSQLCRVARNWDLARLASIDRCVLRLAVAELMLMPQSPTRVVLDEAIELAKSYSTEQSGRFVNGVLDPIAKAVRSGGSTGDAK